MTAPAEVASVPRILVVDDDLALARLLLELLAAHGYSDVRHVTTAAAALPAARDADIVLLDHQLPDGQSTDLLPRLLSHVPAPSVIVITAHGTEALAARALRLGAEDYLRKDDSLRALLPEVVERARRRGALRAAFAAAEAEVLRTERLAAIGEMTVALHHELNNPLMVALAEVDLLREDPGLPDATRAPLAAIRGALLRMRDALQKAAAHRGVARSEYLRGVQMADLHAPVEAPVVRHPDLFHGRAIVSLPDEATARVLGLLLRHAGFEVELAASAAECAAAAATPPRPTLWVVSAGVLLEAEHPQPPAEKPVTLVALAASPEEADTIRGMADLVVLLPFDPATLVPEVLAVMRPG